ncbi:N(5)-(carboxyethyl)ornithine synthase [Jeotgalibaca caeni]|uniref:N(5)-(carboxyethyl)ornithine synthase n=1 Tax=Jeotgalibaca caeni TaxID=3028623 RepID=UPI00237DC659|nr:N(5)-(carboxyethyl)ornithine synthase [Jeotgalibaca caeni]MDE1549626.1 N(5)-(carboxyethyl)ornithine synthase [Jeotgalibaca caeni]
MKIGFVISNYPGEKRVPLLPEDIKNFENEVVIEKGLGAEMGIDDRSYIVRGCTVLSRKEVFATCDTIVSLKLLQPEDYDYIREGQMIIGWTHPTETGKPFMEAQGIPKKLIIVDLDNITPAIYYQDRSIEIPWIPRNFVYENSMNAGFSATLHGLISIGIIPDSRHKVAVLGSGNVSQGAMNAISKFTSNVRMFYRKTLNEFLENIHDYDIIINGIQIQRGTPHVINLERQQHMKRGAIVIDAAADGDGAIQGIEYTPIEEPFVKKNGKYFYCVNNAPTMFYRTASRDISHSFSKWVYRHDVKKFYDLAKEIM